MPVRRVVIKAERSSAGSYDQWLRFEKLPAPETQDTMGASVSVPALQFETWGAFEPVGSDEFPAAQKRHSETTARFRIPYQEFGIDPARHRVVMVFDETTSPPNSSTWNVLGSFGTRFETIIEANQIQ